MARGARGSFPREFTPSESVVSQQAADRPGALPARSQPFNRGRCQTVAKHRIRPRLVRAIPPSGGTPIGLQRPSAALPPTKRIRALSVASPHREQSGSALPRADVGLRAAAIIGFAAVGVAALSGFVAVPGFIGLKLILLAAAIGFGLTIRRVLPPFTIAFAKVLNNPDDGAAQAVVADLLSDVRRYVVGIWITVSLAGLIGIWQPVI